MQYDHTTAVAAPSGFEFTTGRHISAGVEITATYGPKSILALFVQYGFTEAPRDNPDFKLSVSIAGHELQMLTNNFLSLAERAGVLVAIEGYEGLGGRTFLKDIVTKAR